MRISIDDAKARLDLLISKSRVDLYKPIQIAEVLYHSRVNSGLKILDVETYRNLSIKWRNDITRRLLNKISTSSARYQHDIWNKTAMPPETLFVLDAENRATKGQIERYIYMRFSERQQTVADVMAAIDSATPKNFELQNLLALFVEHPGIRRSIDKAYEIVAHSLFETVVTTLGASVRVRVPEKQKELLKEFEDLAQALLGLQPGQTEWEELAHIYRVGVTNAADRGLDMWANFGPAVQVKHLTLDSELAEQIVDQVESDHVVIVCKDADANVIRTIARQIGWGRRVRAIVKESDLIRWYEKCLRGRFAADLGESLLKHLSQGFKAEFPHNTVVHDLMEERGYTAIIPLPRWKTDTDKMVAPASR